MGKNRRKLKILLIEDEIFLVNMYKMLFENAGWEVVATTNLKEALELTQSFNPDIILLDILIPKLPLENVDFKQRYGLDYLKIIRQNPKFKDTPVFVLTNLAEKIEKQKFEPYNIQDYIIKSNLDVQNIVKLIRNFAKENNLL